MTFAGDVVHLDADPVGVLEENRVVPRGELRTVLGRMDDSRLELLDEEMMDRVDVRTTPCAETEMVKARAVLVERAAARALRRSAHEDSGAAADAVDDVLASDERLGTVVRQEVEADSRPARPYRRDAHASGRLPHGF